MPILYLIDHLSSLSDRCIYTSLVYQPYLHQYHQMVKTIHACASCGGLTSASASYTVPQKSRRHSFNSILLLPVILFCITSLYVLQSNDAIISPHQHLQQQLFARKTAEAAEDDAIIVMTFEEMLKASTSSVLSPIESHMEVGVDR